MTRSKAAGAGAVPPKRRQAAPIDRIAYTVNDALATGAFSSRNKLYNAIARGELDSYLDGKRRMIPADSIREYVARRVRATADGEKA